MAYQRTQLTEAVALCRGAVLLLQTALGPVEDARKYVAQVEAAKRRRGRRLPARTGRRPDARLTTCSKPAENRQVDNRRANPRATHDAGPQYSRRGTRRHRHLPRLVKPRPRAL